MPGGSRKFRKPAGWMAAGLVGILWAAGVGDPAASGANEIQRIMHQGAPHEKTPKELVQSGICPQKRQTPQAPDWIYNQDNPLEPTAKNIQAGEALFKLDAQPTACKVCHGLGGDGLGTIFQQLQPKPRNFTCYYTMKDIPDGQMFWIIKNGSPGTRMPAFGNLSDEQIWQLVLYIRQFAGD